LEDNISSTLHHAMKQLGDGIINTSIIDMSAKFVTSMAIN
jgi:hypothetical protein